MSCIPSLPLICLPIPIALTVYPQPHGSQPWLKCWMERTENCGKNVRTKWQELNLRGHVPKTCGWPLPYTRIMGEGLSALSCLPLHAHHLAQCVHHVHQI